MSKRSDELKKRRDELIESFINDRGIIDKYIEMRRNKFAHFHAYSTGNMITAFMQYYIRTKEETGKGEYPEMLGSYDAYAKINRRVKAGKGLHIIVPHKVMTIKCKCGNKTKGKRNIKKGCWYCNHQFTDEELEKISLETEFGVGNVWALADTYGDPIDNFNELISNPKEYSLKDLIKECSYPVILRDTELVKGSTDGKTIYISKNTSEAEQISTLCHEMAHIKLKHLEKDRDDPLFELEAETVAYLTTKMLGFENKKATLYITNWYKDNPGKVVKNGDHLLKIADEILKDFKIDF